MLSDYVSTPPTEPGLYWVQVSEGHKPVVAELVDGHWECIGEAEHWGSECFYAFGPLVITPAEQYGLKKENDFIVNCAAGAWLKLNGIMKMFQSEYRR